MNLAPRPNRCRRLAWACLAALVLSAPAVAERDRARDTAPRRAGGAPAAAEPGTAVPAGAPARTREGRLVLLQEDDFARQRTRLIHLLRTDDGGLHRLRNVGDLPAGWQSGARVRVRGLEHGADLVIADVAGALGVLETAPAGVAGQRTVVALLVDFQNSAVACSTGQVAGLLFDGAQSVDGLYRETSWGQVSFQRDGDGDGQADVFRVSIDDTVAGCEPSAWAAAADQAARNQFGVEPDAYQHKLYVLPQNTGCGWAGLATVGCFGACQAWVATCGLPDVYAHEVGHNLGLLHAATDPDNDGSADSEYGDRSDFMGIGGVGWRRLNGAHVNQSGWLDPDQIAQPAELEATVVLSPLGSDPQAAPFPQLVELPGATIDQLYYLSYRTPTGYDAALSIQYLGGVAIHRWGGQNTLYVTTLADGETFADPAAGITLTQLAHDADTVTLSLEDGCTTGAPELALDPAELATPAGGTVDFEISVTSGDSTGCGAAMVGLAASGPAGWSVTIDPGGLELAPGAQGTATLSVTPPPGTASGIYDATVTATGGAGPTSTIVAGIGVPPPQAPDPPVALVASGQSGRRVVLSWQPAATAGEGTVYRVYRDGELRGVSGGTSFADFGLQRGRTYDYEVAAVSAAGGESAPTGPVSAAMTGSPLVLDRAR